MARDTLGGFELQVLLAVMRLGADAYGVPIADTIEAASGREVPAGSIYITLDRLEEKGLVRPTLRFADRRSSRAVSARPIDRVVLAADDQNDSRGERARFTTPSRRIGACVVRGIGCMGPLQPGCRGPRVVAVHACCDGLSMGSEKRVDPVGVGSHRTYRRVDRRMHGAPISWRTSCGSARDARRGWNR